MGMGWVRADYRMGRRVVEAVIAVTGYIQLGGQYPNLESWAETDDPDEYADSVQKELVLPGEGWQYRNGDDMGDGLTSYTYFLTVQDSDIMAAVLDYAGETVETAAESDLNMGLITGPGEYGYIPCGRSYSLDGMDWNMGGITRIAGCDVAIFPLDEEAARMLDLIEVDG